MSWQIDLGKWREDRGLTEPQNEFLNMFNEEINEAKTSDNIHDVLDGLCDALVVLTNEISQRGYVANEYFEMVEQVNIEANKNEIGTIGISHIAGEDFYLPVEYDKVYLLNMYRKLILTVLKLGYDPKLCMEEVVKHISCRMQDPIQASQWKTDAERRKQEKWKKWKKQPKETIYQPNFEGCKYGK